MIEEYTYAQLAKIHRKKALLKVHPTVLTQGHIFSVSVQKFDYLKDLRISIVIPRGEILYCRELSGEGLVLSQTIEIPKTVKGEIHVLLEIRHNSYWSPIANETVVILKGFWDQLVSEIAKIESVERSESQDLILLREAWALLAFAEDLQERIKKAGPGNVRELKQRLQYLKNKVSLLQQGENPLIAKTGYQLRGYRSPVNGEIQPYSIYVTKNYDEMTSWPLVVMLHGAWSNHHLALRRVMGLSNYPAESDDAAKKFMPQLPDIPYLVVAPNGYETKSYEGFAEDDVWKVMKEMSFLFNIDPDRIYLTGLSMGGAGTAKIGFRQPDHFAALAPVCGFFSPDVWRKQKDDRPEFQKRLEAMVSPHEIAGNLLHIPVKLMHGDKDPIVPVKATKKLYKRLQELGYKVDLEIYPEVDHAAWVPAYENTRIFEWFQQFKRNPAPSELVYKTGNPQGGQSYWITILEPDKIRFFAKIEAKIEGNIVTIYTENIAIFSVKLPKILFNTGKKIKIVVDDQDVYDGKFTPKELFLNFLQGKWKIEHAKYEAKLLPGLNGLDTVLEQPHVYVYGKSGSDEETEIARSLAAAKSLHGGNVDMRFEVMPEDQWVAREQKDLNMVLFSIFSASTFIEKHLNKLPIDIQKEEIHFAGCRIAPDQALTFLYPNPENPNRYLLLNTSMSKEGLKALRAFAGNQRSLQGEVQGDFLVFDKAGSPVWGGLFDKNWKIDTAEDF